MYICICIYLYTCTHIYTITDTHTHTLTHTCQQARFRVPLRQLKKTALRLTTVLVSNSAIFLGRDCRFIYLCYKTLHPKP